MAGKIHIRFIRAYQRLRIWKYSLFSDISRCKNNAQLGQPLLLLGRGQVHLEQCSLGVWPSAHYFSGYIHIEAREASAQILIKKGVCINNAATLIAERTSITIEEDTLIGTEFTVYDSDFHDLHPDRRNAGTHHCRPVRIGRNVFIGSRVTILKGVTIGDGAVIAAGSVVTQDIPANSIAAGTPARVLKTVERHSL